MRNLISILFFVVSLNLHGEQFTVFEQGGYFGIKDQTGNVTVPAIYEKLGWSDGSDQVYNGVIGFKQEKLWGLITVRNKSLTGQKFYTIEPISNNYFKASIKGKFSNHLFHGILDDKGRTIISFNYFTVEPLAANWLVSAFDGKSQKYGVVSFENEIIVPTNYLSIQERASLLLCMQQGKKIDLFNTRGVNLEYGLDSLVYRNGWIAFRDGFAGFLSTTGETIYDFNYKAIQVTNEKVEAIRFPEWKIYRSDSVFLKWECDSLELSQNGLLVAYLNGAHHLLLRNSTLLNSHEFLLKGVSNSNLVVQNSKTRKWSLLSGEGNVLFGGYDSIYSNDGYYAVLKNQEWNLVNGKGHGQNRFSLQDIKQGLGNQFIGQRNDYWGIIDPETENSTTYKYDSIVALESLYLVSYLNRWGAMNDQNSWIIRPEFNEINAIGNFLSGRRGRAYTIFNNGEAVLKTASKPTKELGGFLLLKNEDMYGLMNAFGEMVVYPECDSIVSINNYFELRKNGQTSLITSTGQIILNPDEGYQQVAGYSEEYFLVQKESRWGFIDQQGRLRVSNRYDKARTFQEGMAPVMLRGKWGFIDKSENLIIQPYYDKVSPFMNGLATVQLNQKSGLVDESGMEVLELIWKSVLRLNTGNYLVQDINDQYGLVNENGSFILRPAYDQLSDFGDQILVSKRGTWGVLDYSGRQIFKINHEDIKIVGDFTMIKN